MSQSKQLYKQLMTTRSATGTRCSPSSWSTQYESTENMNIYFENVESSFSLPSCDICNVHLID